MTLTRRRAGKPAGRDYQPNSKKLTQREEEAIVNYILNLDQRGFAPTYAAVRDMADKLLAARGAGQVGQKSSQLVRRTGSLKTSFNRAYDRQRALCEDPILIRSWLELVEQTKAKYGICDEDVYNFDKAGFIIGKIKTQLIVTGPERRGRLKAVQPGNREWATVIKESTLLAGLSRRSSSLLASTPCLPSTRRMYREIGLSPSVTTAGRLTSLELSG